MKVFLDTNIILDFYDSDRGHYMPTAVIFDLAVKGKIQDADIILTRDSKGFNEFDIRHITAEEFLNEFLRS